MVRVLLFLLILLLPRETWAVISAQNWSAGGDAGSVTPFGCTQASPPAASSTVNPANGAQIMVCVTVEGTPAPINSPTLTGSSGVIYTEVATVLSSDGLLRTSLFTGTSNGTSGTISILPAADMPTSSNCTWAIASFIGQDTVTPFVQTATWGALTATTGVTATLLPFADAVNHAAYGCFGHSTTGALTVGTGMTQFTSSSGCCGSRSMHGWQLGERTNVDETGPSGLHSAIAVEIKIPGVAAPTLRRRTAPRHDISMLDYFLAHFSVPAYPGGAYVAG